MVAVCCNGTHCVKNMPSMTTASGTHPVGILSVQVGLMSTFSLVYLSLNLLRYFNANETK